MSVEDRNQENTEELEKVYPNDSINEVLALLNRVVAAAVTSIVVADPHLPDCPIVYHNPAFEGLTGYSSAEIDGKNCRFLQGSDRDQEAVAELREAIRAEKSCFVTLRNYRKDGSLFYNELAMSPVFDVAGKLTHFVGVQSDVTKRKDAEHERDVLLAQQSKVAETLQRAMLLGGETTPSPGWQLATQYEPAQSELKIGGDFFDTFALTENKLALVVGDVTGKGLAAARHTAEVKYALRVLLREYSQPAPALSRLNNFLLESQRLDDRDQNALVCVAVAVVDTATGTGELASGGMEPMLLLNNGEAKSVSPVGVILGVSKEAHYDSAPFTLAEGDTLILVTDGVTEARSKDRSFFGYDSLVESATNAATSNATVESIGEAVITAAKEYGGGSAGDDICILVARRTPL
ncbi:MAG: SpoIIE family protein phosphatase [Armatimonadetes bacterium]|nr:SpoIIE family protein phosphatase [Armatimonadota bacterium]